MIWKLTGSLDWLRCCAEKSFVDRLIVRNGDRVINIDRCVRHFSETFMDPAYFFQNSISPVFAFYEILYNPA